MDNPEILATYGTQDTGQINDREYQRGNKKWTIQRFWQPFICPVSCVPYVASFSGLSIFDCLFGILYRLFVLCLVYRMLPVSLDCPFFFAPTMFSNVYLSCETQDKQMLENTEGAKKKGQSRETGNIQYTRHRTNKR
jgi:hypothetical protein